MAGKTNLFKKLQWTNFIFLTFAGVVNAVGVTLFLGAVGLYDGGFSGTSMILADVTAVDMSIFLLVLNVPFFLFGYRKLGMRFIVYSLYAIAVYSLFAFLFQQVFPIDFSAGSPIAGNDLLLCALFGGRASGIGSGTTIRFGGAIDGVEVLAIIFAKKLGATVGTFIMCYNLVLYGIAAILTGQWSVALYSVIAYAIGLKAVDFIVDGLDKAKSAFIITDHKEELAEQLTQQFGRGVTVIDAEGYYSQTNKTVLYCVVNRFEINKLKEVVVATDPNAFVVINDVTDSLGSTLRYKYVAKNRKGEKQK